MPDPTTNYGWDLPNVGGDVGAWGTVANNVWNAIDTVVKAVSDIANAALAKAGGVMTGRLDAKTATMARVDKGAISGAQSLDLSAGQYFTLTVSGALTLSITNPPAGQFAYGIILRITNGGSSVITWPASVKWPSASAPVLTAAGIDIIVLLSDDNGVTFKGILAAKDVR
jgi:hypothetical protein